MKSYNGPSLPQSILEEIDSSKGVVILLNDLRYFTQSQV